MALKFLNKKGWHTGSLRNIENVWKAEQKHEAEQRKLEELRKQIQEERERAEFRLLQERAGLVPRQERLDFLYESGLAVGKSSSEGFKALQGPPQTETSAVSASEASSSKAAVPGALFEDKPQSANDAWRKLHSDPLLLIRQKEQDAVARIKNNPIQMAMIKKSVEVERQQQEKSDKKLKKKKKEHKKHRRKKSKHDRHSSESSDSEDMDKGEEERRHKHRHRRHQVDNEERKRKHRDRGNEADNEERRPMRRDREDEGWREGGRPDKHGDREDERWKGRDSGAEHRSSRVDGGEERRRHRSSDDHRVRVDSREERSERFASGHHLRDHRDHQPPDKPQEKSDTHRRRRPPGLTEQERAARLREMQMDAELHEEQRWKRIKRASEADAREAVKDKPSLGGNNFLDATRKSLFGTERGGSSTIEESVRRRAFYSQGGVAAHETNAFRRQ